MVFANYVLGSGLTLLHAEKPSSGARSFNLDFPYESYDQIQVLFLGLIGSLTTPTAFNTGIVQFRDLSNNVLGQQWGLIRTASGGNTLSSSTTSLSWGLAKAETSPVDSDYFAMIINMYKSQLTNDLWIVSGNKGNMGDTSNDFTQFNGKIDTSTFALERLHFNTGNDSFQISIVDEFYIFGRS